MKIIVALFLLVALVGAAASGGVHSRGALTADFTVPEAANIISSTAGQLTGSMQQQRRPPPAGGPAAGSAPHRQGMFTVQVPAGAQNLELKLKHHDFIFGTAFSPETASDVEWYQNQTAAMFWGIVPENQFKWFNYETQPGVYQQAKDRLDNDYMTFAKAANLSMVRGHTLEWLKTDHFWAHELSCEEYVAALKERITRDVAAFAGKFTTYDVFNEVLMWPGMLDTCDLWDTAFPDAFKWAHQADPNATLCINDFGLIEADGAPKMIRIIQNHLLAHGAPIHCIGIQAHLTADGINMTHMQHNLDLLAGLGLDLYITEFSLFSTWEGPKGQPISFLDEDTQAQTTVDLFRLWFNHPAVKGIFMWGFWEDNIWIKGAGIYHKNKTPKKAALAIQDLWNEWNTEVQVGQPAGSTTFAGFYGEYDWSFTTPSGAVRKGRVHFGKGRGRGERAVAVLGRPTSA